MLDVFKVANTQEKQREKWLVWVQCSRIQYLVVLLHCCGCGGVEHHPSRPRDGRCCSPQGGWKAEQCRGGKGPGTGHSSMVDSKDLFPPGQVWLPNVFITSQPWHGVTNSPAHSRSQSPCSSIPLLQSPPLSLACTGVLAFSTRAFGAEAF